MCGLKSQVLFKTMTNTLKNLATPKVTQVVLNRLPFTLLE